MKNELSNEQNFLIQISRLTFLKSNETELEALLSKNLNWIDIYRMAIKNKVLNLMWYNLSKMGYENYIPSNLERIAYFSYLGTKKRNKAYLEELKRIITIMNINGTSCVPLKGAYLIKHLYKDLGIRTINDIDCLIRHRDIGKVLSIMNKQGYIEGEYDNKTNSIKPVSRGKKILWNMKMNNLLPLVKISKSKYVKISEFDFCFSLDLDIKKEPVDIMISRTITEGNDGFNYLKPSDCFLHLCCHLYKEATNSMWVMIEKDLNLIKFCDIREFVIQKMDESALEESVQFAKEYGLERAIYFTLYYLNEIYADGYENKIMNKLDLDNNSFLNTYGERDFGKGIIWKKSFWQRMFSDNNKDELNTLPKYYQL